MKFVLVNQNCPYSDRRELVSTNMFDALREGLDILGYEVRERPDYPGSYELATIDVNVDAIPLDIMDGQDAMAEALELLGYIVQEV
jgi:hypothetical protein